MTMTEARPASAKLAFGATFRAIFCLTTDARASAHAQLSGWGTPRHEILERFE
ncbi:MAG: hypothetical protein ACFCUW_03825 [Kiloniellaceae bacterium]